MNENLIHYLIESCLALALAIVERKRRRYKNRHRKDVMED